MPEVQSIRDFDTRIERHKGHTSFAFVLNDTEPMPNRAQWASETPTPGVFLGVPKHNEE
jgi:hypothetical protein